MRSQFIIRTKNANVLIDTPTNHVVRCSRNPANRSPGDIKQDVIILNFDMVKQRRFVLVDVNKSIASKTIEMNIH